MTLFDSFAILIQMVAVATNKFLEGKMDPLMRYISRISRCAILYRSEKLVDDGLNGCQNLYIQNICRTPGMTQDQLAKMILVNKSNVARQLAILEQDGFVRREACETDRRQMQVYPTQKAMDIYPKVKEVLGEWNLKLMACLSEEEQGALLIMMEKLLNKAIQLSDATGPRDRELT